MSASTEESTGRPTWRTGKPLPGDADDNAIPDKHDTENPAAGEPRTSEEQARRDRLPPNDEAATPEGDPLDDEAGSPPENPEPPRPERVDAHEHR